MLFLPQSSGPHWAPVGEGLSYTIDTKHVSLTGLLRSETHSTSLSNKRKVIDSCTWGILGWIDPLVVANVMVDCQGPGHGETGST